MLKIFFLFFMMIWMSVMFSQVEMMLILLMSIFMIFFQMLNYNWSDLTMCLGGDYMSINLILLSMWISFLMILSSVNMSLLNKKYFLFYIFLMMFLLFVCFFSLNLIMFYFFFEFILFPIIMLIFNWGNQPERLQAGLYMLMYTLLGSLPLLVMILIYNNYSFHYFLLNWIYTNKMNYMYVFMILGFLVKIPMYLLHLWLPKAHVEAPISGSMILAAILLKLGIYGIYRFKKFFLEELMELSWIIMIISMWGGMMVGLLCLFQTDIKSLIAYSSICHMGVVLGGTLSMNFWSSYGSLLLMLGHGLCSSGLFCLGNFMYERFFTRSMMLLKGMNKVFPNLSFWWFLFSIINMSAPPSMNIFGEIFLMGGLMKFSIYFMFPLMMISFFSACYSLFLFSYINHGESWVFWSTNMISMREYLIMCMHFLPLILWTFKMECFSMWI
uniref:NADH dehydrogenase subunit 4 n=1 Tax=Ixodes rubicundus TaxID=722771 RepID=UPI00223710F2|nr:NADH dehydrogenase subunit 4 [Ixodes rubicundus]UYB78127.1 NADH dehydrogenase subunit 4 [Ixodes rubicundus]